MYFTKFNQDNSCIAVATQNGYHIYTLDPIELKFTDNKEGVGCVEMLYTTSLVALVGSGHTPGSSPRKLKLWNIQQNELISEIMFESSIADVRLSKQRMLVCFQDAIHIYDITTLKCIQILSSKSPLSAISFNPEPNCYLAFPTHSNMIGVGWAPNQNVSKDHDGPTGDVVIFDTISLRLISHITAHKSNVVAIEFNSTGSLVATASSTGTVIRVFSIPAGQLLFSFRRGASSVHINSISFDSLSRFVAVGSGSGTIHIFSMLTLPAEAQSNGISGSESSSVFSNISNLTKDNIVSSVKQGAWTAISVAGEWGKALVDKVGVAHYVPESITEFSNSTRAVSVIRVPNEVKSFKVSFIKSTTVPAVEDNELPGGGMDLSNIGKLALVDVDSCHYYRYRLILNNSTADAGEDHSNRSVSQDLPTSGRPSESEMIGRGTGVFHGVIEDEALLI